MSKSQARAASRQTQSRATKRSSPLSVPARAAKAVGAKLVGSKAVSTKAVSTKPSVVKSSSRSAVATAKPPAKVTRPAAAVASRAPARAVQPGSRAGTVAAPASPSRGAIAPSRVIEVTAPVQAPSAPDALWTAYFAAKSRSDEARVQDLRNRLIERYYEVVRFTAERMHTRLPNEVDVNDLMSSGLFGLMDAIDAFDPGRGVKFETYCAPRIRGAIFDELRSMDWVPRLVRSRTAKVEKVRKEFELTHGRKPTDDEISARMNVSGAEYDKLQKDSRPVGVVSLDRKAFESDSSREVREVDVIEDGRQPNPMEIVQRGDLQTLITKGLSRAERLIVILYYYEEMTMKEIGLTLDLSESRVSQMHSSILARLKAQMQHRLKEF
jgi:RNA polymerase sigma factor for flagellar operon FliA